MLIIHTSNRLEALAEMLAGMIRQNPLPPLMPETVVTQSIGMSRWLCLSLAEKLGVAANFVFPFPARFAEEELARLLPAQACSPIYRREVLPWRIHAVLAPLLEDADFKQLGEYAGDDSERTWHLCQQLAATFDRYVAHRPQMLREWDAGRSTPEERWQAKLWKALGDGAQHPAALLMKAMSLPPDTSAPRCAIFGLSALAPTYLEFLSMVSTHREVHLFLLAPTRHYWGDIQSEREKARLIKWSARHNKIAGAEHSEPGHPLLASLGKVGRDFHEALVELSATEEPDAFISSGGDTLLGRLQDDILELTPLDEERDALPPDDSLRLHNCHSPVRELEVLHDQLLAAFEADPSLTPRDVLVAVPDIEDYAPFIDGVFGAPESEAVRFPYSIADREVRAESSVADAFLRALELVESRFPASAVLTLLDCPAVHTKFGFTETDLPLVRQWIVDSGIRWGRDAEHRAELNLPQSREHTWQFGLDRLILGFALPGDGTQLFHNILPEPAVEGSLADTLGRFALFAHTLFEKAAELRLPRSVAEWVTSLQSTLTALCENDHDFAERWTDVAQTMAEIAANAALAQHREVVPFSVIRDCVREALEGSQRATAFLRGGITFCSLRPMRAIPHRVVCLLGIHDTAFPRQDRAPAFDLTAAQPRPGDRSTRDDDRYLFLEALISARDRLIISWCGQSARDNSPLPPSVIVSELLDVLVRHYGVAVDALITNHRLQPFSRRYFEGGALFSYSADNALGASSALTPGPAQPFVATLPPEPPSPDVSLDRLIEALTRPARFFASERLGIQLPYEEAQPQDSEPFETGRLEEYALASRLTDAHFAGTDIDSLFKSTTATGMLSHGYAGESFFQDTALEVRRLTSRAPDSAKEPVPVLVALGQWRIAGTLRIVTTEGLLSLRPATLKGRDYLRAWISHLVLCASEPTGLHPRSILIGDDGAFEYAKVPCEEASQHLLALLELYATLHEKPIPLFPESAHDFATYSLNIGGRKKKDPHEAAASKWFGGQYAVGRPESRDPWNSLVWRDEPNPLGDEFARISLAVFSPLLNYLTSRK